MNVLPDTVNSEYSPDTPDLLGEFYSVVSKWPRPSWDQYFMATAMLIASRSACDRLHVGCILVSEGDHKNRIIAAGYNGFLPGAPHNSVVRDGHELATVHAEQNAITDAARRGVTVQNSQAYLTHYPCVHCSKMLIAAGVKTIKYHFDYKNDPLVQQLLNDSRVPITQL
ncbi:MAG: dCMP deaminase [Verrucomicrobia bacterium CG_4_10_14_3_um_filter_43_23]|nr:MAG: dCMP deaminase [Verrucomicrobia bacterium CG22_combo_CG10-13_8_21_14_all_43_17]PIX57707.1 MAG: dCMP deaminase [Verrucomicrobia bacterium CG_4_10_14_3_um_filter_43_23]PIY62499.1 MAG: dCMP deaminase [Verrucomicrobia bacterium CG_4_10_14_0_8_um_filter_43_34]PJA44681.1 MAG: dCMP deaminase [Verrucomicrobia bacterium CG_4_9_14_3_um_filter_43_20]